MRDNNSTFEIENKDFEHITSAMPKITQRYVSKSLCGQLVKKDLEILKGNNSTLEIENKERYVNKSLCGQFATDNNSKLEIYDKDFDTITGLSRQEGRNYGCRPPALSIGDLNF